MVNRPQTFLLVHGAWHGAWCWQKVRMQLTQAGHRVIAPDLPGSGRDRTPLAEVTFASYVDRVLDLIARSSEPVILIGHSLGGMTISQVAEERPEKIRWLVYLTALLPCDGESTLSIQSSSSSQDQAILSCVEADQQSMRLRFDLAMPLFYHDCSPGDVQIAQRLLKPQALLPLQTPVTLGQHFANVPKAYLSCRHDRVLTPALQDWFWTRTPCQHIHVFDGGHSPFFSRPGQLAACLEYIGASEPTDIMEAPEDGATRSPEDKCVG